MSTLEPVLVLGMATVFALVVLKLAAIVADIANRLHDTNEDAAPTTDSDEQESTDDHRG